MLRLRNTQAALANFFASGLLCLGRKLGPILWQLPPKLQFDPSSLRSFLELLPKTTREVERLARLHDARLRGRSVVEALTEVGRVRYVFEVRHPSFETPRFGELLREYNVAACVADSAGLYPFIDEATADFAYARLHGTGTLYVGGYDRAELQSWARRIRRWRKRGDVYVYFDNDVKVRAPFDAQNLARLLEGRPELPLPPTLASVTEEPRTGWPEW
jgi:uncharacterized protein YecE (DUF72 family)